jgi:hypothetical protein
MSLFVVISEYAKRDAIGHNCLPQIEKFAAQLLTTQTLDLFDRFPQPHLKKGFGKQIRLIAEERFLEDNTIICFLRVLIRGSNEYASFLTTKEVPKGERLRAELTDEALATFIQSTRIKPTAAPPPSDAESQYLFAALNEAANPYDDYVCCEMRLWFDRMKDPEFAARISQFQEPIFETFDEAGLGLIEKRLPGASDFGFLFRHFPKSKTVVLFTPFRGTANRSEVEALYPELTMPEHVELPHETILRHTRQAYPLTVLDNLEAWFAIEKEDEGNIALSYEEVEVLQSPQTKDPEGFPLFINGRAGSGKSTILQYLFSDYLYFYFKNRISGPPPIFFASNDDLIDQAKKSVRRILIAKQRTDVERLGRFDSIHLDLDFNNAFANFQTWLVGLGSSWTYDLRKRIDYGAFKKWWSKRFAHEAAATRLYGPDVSWHVIRSYIKGANPEQFLDPEDYAEMPERQKSVSLETYQLVFDRVWAKYSADQHKNQLWDDQDLARRVLAEELVVASRPVVFCDEAQDLTRVDLQILLRLSLFSNRFLEGYQVLKVPFAFAGDPFQTLNPTGFRWEATRANFVEKFVWRNRNTRTKTDLNYCELTYNYRSTRNIVLFCNTLQLLRSVLFNIGEIKPQIPWFEERDSPMPVYFDRSDLNVMRRLAEQSEIRIIIPCEEGGEVEYLSQHPELGEFVEKDDLGIPKNVVSAMRVKGLEFKRVVLFGFGEECPRELLNVLRHPESAPLSGDRSIEAQYFFNRLYVAASRPRRRLFIVDSQQALLDFWGFGRDEDLRDEFALLSANIDVWSDDNIGLLAEGQNDSWEEDREDARETADKLASEGRIRKDRVLLRQAAQSYKSAGSQLLARQCRAEALELEEEYLKAADIYEQLEQFDNAFRACWKAGSSGMDRILDLAMVRVHLQTRIEYIAAAFVKLDRSFDDGLTLLKDILGHLEDERRRTEMVTEPAWRDAMLCFRDRFLQLGDDSPGTWKVVTSYFEEIGKAGLAVGPLPLGELYFRAGDHRNAYALWSSVWDSISDEQRRSIEVAYYESQAFATEYPEKLFVLERLLAIERIDAASRIIEAYQLFGPGKLRDEHWSVVARALIARGRNDDLVAILPHLAGESILLASMDSLLKNGVDRGVIETVAKLIALWDKNSEWKKTVELWTGGRLDRIELPAEGKVRFEDQLNKIVVEAAAQATALRTEDNLIRTVFSERLNRIFMVNFSWADRIHPLVVGAAFETGGLFRHILPYYERVEGNLNFHASTRIGAARRWLKTKDRQLRVEGSRRSTRLALEEKMASLGLSDLSRIADFPNLTKLPPIFAELAQPVAQPFLSKVRKMFSGSQDSPKTFGSLRVTLSGDKKRINFENTQSLEQGTAFPSEKRVVIDGVEISRDEPVVELATWGYTIEFSDSILLVRDQSGDELEINLAG